MSSRGVLAVLAAAGLCLSGCSADDASAGSVTTTTPTTTTTTTTPTTTTPMGIGRAPKVAHPLDPAKKIAAPCTSLTAHQAKQDGLAELGDTVPDPDGPTCEWRRTTGRISTLRVTWLADPHDTLTWMYAHWQDYSDLSPVTTSDHHGRAYPGVYAAKPGQDTDMFLAVNDKTLCRLHVNTPRAKHPAPPDGGLVLYANSLVANLEQG